MASIVEWNISESFCLQYFYRCVFYSFLYFLKRNEFWFVVHLQSKIGLHKTPQAAQALASDEDVKRILRGFVTFVKHSSRIPLRSTSAWEATQALVCKWFPQKKTSTEKKYLFSGAYRLLLLWHVMLDKNMLHRYMLGKYILSLQVWETNFYSESITHISPQKTNVRPLMINMGGKKLHNPWNGREHKRIVWEFRLNI